MARNYRLAPHLRVETKDIGEYILFPGDPGRAKLIAEEFLENADLINNHRGLAVYTGFYKGIKVSAVTSGMGCPSAAIVMEELANLGARVVIRVGTCGSLSKQIKPGSIVIPFAAARFEGTTREYLPVEIPAVADVDVYNALMKAAKDLNEEVFTGINRTHDGFYEPMENFLKLKGLPLVTSEMEVSAVFVIGMLRKIKTGAILVVNTYEPPEEVEKNPEIIYELSDEEAVKRGIKKEIKIALHAIDLLNDKKEA